MVLQSVTVPLSVSVRWVSCVSMGPIEPLPGWSGLWRAASCACVPCCPSAISVRLLTRLRCMLQYDTCRISILYLLDLDGPAGLCPPGPTCARAQSTLVSDTSSGMHARIPSVGSRYAHTWTRVTRLGDPRQCDIQHAPMTRHGLVTPSGGHAVFTHV
jgi:hypothetical protein